MNAREIQKQIEQTHYWDKVVLDLQVNYLGTEVVVFYGQESDAWKLIFKACRSLRYESFVPNDDIKMMKAKTPSQFDYFGHEILIDQVPASDYYLARLNFQFLEMEIEFQTIGVEKVESWPWFWEKGE